MFRKVTGKKKKKREGSRKFASCSKEEIGQGYEGKAYKMLSEEPDSSSPV